MEIELNFRLDADGRTANTRGESDESRKTEDGGKPMDYSCKAVATNLNDLSNEALDDILFDCEISDSGLMPRTFWVPVEGMKPRCSLEQFALDIFHHHVPPSHDFDKETSGVEWWCQIRPSPETGRYAMHDDKPDEISQTGISFHWDKDEDLRIMAGGNLYVHPHLSTVTYLTDLGSPTLVANCRVNNLNGEWITPDAIGSKEEKAAVFVSWPKRGKHMSFDGRYLHAALPDLMEPGMFEKQIQFQSSDNPKEQKQLIRKHRRVTFLVNIWLNYRPFNTHPFPQTMIDKLSGGKEDRVGLKFQSTDSVPTKKVATSSTTTKDNKNHQSLDSLSCHTEDFEWPMGDCDSTETIRVGIPLARIRDAASLGGNVMIEQVENDEALFSLQRGSPAIELPKRTQQEESGEGTKRARTE
eukprot:scaffold4637_cov128-Cylindrotheca_fusiformis.AAC.18